jgi:hypothetical protein
MRHLARIQQLAVSWISDHPQQVVCGNMARGQPSEGIAMGRLSVADQVCVVVVVMCRSAVSAAVWQHVDHVDSTVTGQ